MDEAYQKLLVQALKYISIRKRSSREIREYVEKKDAAHADDVFRRMEELGYVDDRAFAVWWISSRRRSHQKGDRILKLELKAKGVASDIIDGLLSGGGSEEIDAARHLFVKKYRMFDLPQQERKQKMFRYFLNRGFSSDIIRTLIDENR